MTAELIVGLDLPTRAQAEDVIARLDGVADFFKIGYQLVYGGEGLTVGAELIKAGKRVFFDLKLHDIDNTVFEGIAAFARSGAAMATVHAYPRTMRAAAKAAEGSRLTVLGVTVLTSMDQDDLLEAGYAMPVADLVARRAQQAVEAGIGGLVASAHEAEKIRAIVGPNMAIVTPGIRPSGSETGDQKRVMTPREAIRAGASHLVIARPIVQAPDPRVAASAILDEMATA